MGRRRPDSPRGWRKLPNRVKGTTAIVDFLRQGLGLSPGGLAVMSGSDWTLLPDFALANLGQLPDSV